MTQATSFIQAKPEEAVEVLEAPVIVEEEIQEASTENEILTDEVIEKLRSIKPSQPQETPPVASDNGEEEPPSSQGATEENEKIITETLTRIRPLFEHVKTHTQSHREYNRQIGIIINEDKKRIKGKKHGKMFIPRIAEQLKTSMTYLGDVCQYAKVDPGESSIVPENLAYLSWRRVVRCARAAKTQEKFVTFLQGHSDLIELSKNAFDELVEKVLPRTEKRGRRREPLNTTNAENQANGLGDNGQTKPSERKPLPPNVEKAFNDLVNEDDSPWKDNVKIYSGEGCFEFQATFHTEAECVTVFKHFITYLDKEAV